jgi:hypothetical protein
MQRRRGTGKRAPRTGRPAKSADRKELTVPRRRTPTPKKINEMNRAVWEKWNAQIEDFEQRYPERAKKAGQRAARLIHAGHINDPDLAAETS